MNVLFLPYKKGNRIYAIIYTLFAFASFSDAVSEYNNGFSLLNSWSSALFLLFFGLSIYCWIKPKGESYSFSKDKQDIINFFKSLF